MGIWRAHTQVRLIGLANAEHVKCNTKSMLCDKRKGHIFGSDKCPGSNSAKCSDKMKMIQIKLNHYRVCTGRLEIGGVKNYNKRTPENLDNNV